MTSFSGSLPAPSAGSYGRVAAGLAAWGNEKELHGIGPSFLDDDPVAAAIIGCVIQLRAEGLPVSPGIVHDQLRAELEPEGGVVFLAELIRVAHAGPSMAECANEIKGAWMRRHLMQVGEVVQNLGLEMVQDAAGVTSRASAREQALDALCRLGATYAVVQAIIRPLPPLLAGGPGDTARIVNLLPAEIEELASSHDALAVAEARLGRAHDAECRRARARQLREIAVPPA